MPAVADEGGGGLVENWVLQVVDGPGVLSLPDPTHLLSVSLFGKRLPWLHFNGIMILLFIEGES